MKKKIELEIVALSHNVTQSQNFAVVLGEQNGSRRLPIVIGGFEAQAIAVAIERMAPNRPLTHDLFKNTLATFDIELKEIVINNLLDGIFYSRLVCLRGEEQIEIDSRTSDALAMAVRFNCPIYTYDFILDAAGVVLEDEEQESRGGRKTERKSSAGNSLANLSSAELQSLLDEMLANENYERAAAIRDEMKKRQEKDS